MNAKGFVRTLEAVIAILLLLMLLFYVLPEAEAPTGEVPAEVKTAQQYILQEVSLNQAYRDCVIGASPGDCRQGCLATINTFIAQHTPFGYMSACEVCASALSCMTSTLPLDRSLYTDSIFISKGGVTKILRVYFYEK